MNLNANSQLPVPESLSALLIFPVRVEHLLMSAGASSIFQLLPQRCYLRFINGSGMKAATRAGAETFTLSVE